MGNKKTYTEPTINFLKENYPNKGADWCAAELKLTRSVVKSLASRYKIKINNRGSVNIEDFYNITKPEIAYFLGILWADGYISKGRRIDFTIVEEDAVYIDDVMKKVGDWNIYHRQQEKNWKKQRTYNLTDCQLIPFLTENGYKTDARLILKKIPEHLHKYWFRGLIDGDGCVGFYPHLLAYNVNISSDINENWNYISEKCDFLDIKYAIRKKSYINNKTGKTNSCSQFVVQRKNDIIKFLDYIYNEREIDLIGFQRKYNKYMQMKDHFSK